MCVFICDFSLSCQPYIVKFSPHHWPWSVKFYSLGQESQRSTDSVGFLLSTNLLEAGPCSRNTLGIPALRRKRQRILGVSWLASLGKLTNSRPTRALHCGQRRKSEGCCPLTFTCTNPHEHAPPVTRTHPYTSSSSGCGQVCLQKRERNSCVFACLFSVNLIHSLKHSWCSKEIPLFEGRPLVRDSVMEPEGSELSLKCQGWVVTDVWFCSFQGSIYRKIHFLYSLVPGSADDSGTSQTELWQMGCADLMLFTATQQRAWLDTRSSGSPQCSLQDFAYIAEWGIRPSLAGTWQDQHSGLNQYRSHNTPSFLSPSEAVCRPPFWAETWCSLDQLHLLSLWIYFSAVLSKTVLKK